MEVIFEASNYSHTRSYEIYQLEAYHHTLMPHLNARFKTYIMSRSLYQDVDNYKVFLVLGSLPCPVRRLNQFGYDRLQLTHAQCRVLGKPRESSNPGIVKARNQLQHQVLRKSPAKLFMPTTKSKILQILPLHHSRPAAGCFAALPHDPQGTWPRSSCWRHVDPIPWVTTRMEYHSRYS